MLLSRKISSILPSRIEIEVKKSNPEIKISSSGCKNIINSVEFWNDFIPFFVEFIKKHPKIRDKRIAKLDQKSNKS
jgi:hypothetical protein